MQGDYYIPLSQQEIADINHMSKLKTNRLLRDLIEGEYVYPYQDKRGKYAITEKGQKVLRLIQKKTLDEGENDVTIIRQDKTRQDKTRQVIKVISLTSFYATKRRTEFTTKCVSSVFCV